MEVYKYSVCRVRFWLLVLATYFVFSLNASAQTMTVTAKLQGTSVVLNWPAVAGTTYYFIERNGTIIASAASTATSYTDTALELGRTYSYVVQPVGTAGINVSGSKPVSIQVSSFNYSTQAPSDFQHNLSAIHVPILDNLAPVAITQGSASVNNGSLGYKVAIETPPGVNNHVPTLAISYNSNAGNGIAGVGWSLAGLSAISRCAPTVATDGTGVSDPYTNKDDLCLDGQRLVLKGYTNNVGVSRSTYWASGTTYVTEQANFTEITSQGSGALSSEPNSFIAKTKDGKTLYFGEANRNAKVFAADDPNKGTKSWHLTRVSDRYGNEYTVDYNYDTSSGEHLPSHILYAPGAAVVFNYVQRLGQIPWGSKDGKKYRQPNVLKSIDTYINVTNSQYPRGGTPVRRYNFEYKLSPSTGRDLVSTIEECGWVTQWNCAKPLTFNYEPGSFVGQEFPSPTTTTGSYPPQYTDIDGDEYNDALTDDGSVFWGQANGQFSSEDWSTSVDEDYWDSQIAPIRTRDGIAIVVRKIKSGWVDSQGNVVELTGGVISIPAGSSYTPPTMQPTTQSISVIHSINRANRSKKVTKLNFSTGRDDPYTVGAFTIGDYDCDGLDDMYYKGKLYTQAVNGHPSTWVLDNSTYASPKVYMANTAGPCSVKKPVFTSNNGLKVDGTYSVIKPSMVDLNGDGNKELISHQSSTYNKTYRVGGDGFSMEAEQVLSGGNAATLHKDCFSFTYDLDEDGREDIFGVSPTSGFSAFLARDNGGSQAFLSAPISLDYFANYTDIIDSCTENKDIRSTDILVGDINSDGRPDLQGRNGFMSFPKKSDMLVQVTNGFGAETVLTYSTLSKDIYSPSSIKPQFPYAPASRGMWVVKSIATTNGKGGYNTQNYRYKGAVTHLQGRGFAGFEQITVTDEAKGLVNETNYYQQWPKTGKVSQQLIKDTSNKLISLQNTQYTSITGNGEFVYSRLQTQKTYGLLTTSISSPISTKVIENQIDSCGNPQWQSQRVGHNYSNGVLSGELSRIDTAYVLNAGQANTCTDDFIGQTSVTYTSGSETEVVQTGFTKNAQGDIATRTDYQGTALERETVIARTAQGVTSGITETAKDIDSTTAQARQTRFSNFEASAWPRTVTNALNQSTALTYDPRFGSVQTQTNSFVNTTTNYDELGRVTSVKTKDNTLTENISFYCANNSVITCPEGAVYGVATIITNSSAAGYLGAPLSIVFYDILQREIQSSIYGFDGNVTNKSIEYLANGRVARVSEPFLTYGVQASATGSVWTTYSGYDALGRAGTVVPAAGGSITTSYRYVGYAVRKSVSTLVVSTSGNQPQLLETDFNALGQVIQAYDGGARGGVAYTYDIQGNLKTTQVNNDTRTLITLTHDIAGNKTHISDPDAKNIQFEYNGFGELRRQSWQPLLAQKKTLTFSYDRIGRKTQRVDNGPGLSGTYNWTYDQNNQPGMLTGRSGGGLVDSYSYNANGQLQSSSHTVDGKTYNLGYQYDAFGRLTRSTSPDNFAAIREYSAQGYQVRTQGNRYQYTNVLWALGKQQDDRGNFTHQLNGNGVITRHTFDAASGYLTNIRSGRWSDASTLNNLSGDIQSLNYRYDSLGNLLYRESKRTDMNGTPLESLTETLTYDALNRLDTSTGTGTYRRNYDYDDLGNLTLREDKASSRSTATNNDIGALLYENVRNAGPHAVTSAGGKIYGYDLYGNMTQRGSETLTYDIFNKPTRIAGATTSNFYYDADHQLYKQVVNGVTTIYLGNVEIIREGATTTTNTYIDGVAQHRFVDNGVSGGADYYYLHRDNLGSVEATSSSAGYFQNRMSFDAWGSRRSDTSWAIGSPTVSSLTKQGYTGHEQLDSHKLVHMQGRVYDPALGRFLSADLFVQSPHSTQSFNRYSYVSNNPLSRIDPTGYADVGYGGRSGPEPADGVDCTKNPSQCPGTTHYNSCSDGATCMTGGEADSYMRDLAAMQTNSLGGMMGVPDINFGSVQEIRTYLEEKAVKQSDGSYVLQTADGPARITLAAGDKNGKGVGLPPAGGGKTSHILKDPSSYIGRKDFLYGGKRECAAFVQQAGGAPQTKTWAFGDKPNKDTPIGTIIGTPGPDGKYGQYNSKGGFEGHVAVFMGLNNDGSLKVIHQYRNMDSVDKGTIYDRPEGTYISRDASRYQILLW